MMAEPTYHYPIQRKPMPNLHPHTTGRTTPDSSFAPTYSHSRTRNSSSSNNPSNLSPYPSKPSYSQQQHPQQHPPSQPTSLHPTRRHPSTHTFSSFSPSTTATSPTVNRTPSSSSRPFPAPQNQGYVALLRKQKATVWCDRAQHLDPRHLAAQRAAKARAHLEVAGAPDSGRAMTTTSTAQSGLASGGSRVAAKIRHHGKAGLVGYAPAGDFGVGVGGVPMRLSATEVEGGDSDGEDAVSSVQHHQRTGSGRSSLGSSKRGFGMRQSGSGTGARWSGGTPAATPRDSAGEFDFVVVPPGGVLGGTPGSGCGADGGSMASGSSAERGDAVAELDTVRVTNSLLKQVGGEGVTREKSMRNPEELRRRGSVDERTMTMSAQRLFVANPDEDSD
ncbi:hypothetical protein VC83_09338 [Pseudogymnoascus destructans]|uniref:Uncharacterized protein n=2 Tax=Pseudogymnoascus destructans TaxID=655981 RepID=L8FSV4_PSED2|nr:uncharacterized protein VC83_09338 [Pseudogymnoascus destructans]ELR03624.1 hypothetical protein GMDG_06274 [Pseudogymnoascus destructans 20631-21]OAF54363.1 hypothetical protein VC83_09338 [Pseudogymnoascus destructans]